MADESSLYKTMMRNERFVRSSSVVEDKPKTTGPDDTPAAPPPPTEAKTGEAPAAPAPPSEPSNKEPETTTAEVAAVALESAKAELKARERAGSTADEMEALKAQVAALKEANEKLEREAAEKAALQKKVDELEQRLNKRRSSNLEDIAGGDWKEKLKALEAENDNLKGLADDKDYLEYQVTDLHDQLQAAEKLIEEQKVALVQGSSVSPEELATLIRGGKPPPRATSSASRRKRPSKRRIAALKKLEEMKDKLAALEKENKELQASKESADKLQAKVGTMEAEIGRLQDAIIETQKVVADSDMLSVTSSDSFRTVMGNVPGGSIPGQLPLPTRSASVNPPAPDPPVGSGSK